MRSWPRFGTWLCSSQRVKQVEVESENMQGQIRFISMEKMKQTVSQVLDKEMKKDKLMVCHRFFIVFHFSSSFLVANYKLMGIPTKANLLHQVWIQ